MLSAEILFTTQTRPLPKNPDRQLIWQLPGHFLSFWFLQSSSRFPSKQVRPWQRIESDFFYQ
jgi:hypothetical protein